MQGVEQEVERLCQAGLDLDAVRTRVLRSLNRVMPVDTAFVATADPRTLLFSGVAVDEPLAAVSQQFLDNEFGGTDVNHFAALAMASPHVGSLDHATHLERSASPRYREIMRPLGLGDELRAALVVGGDCWGYLCLHREDHRLGFTEDEAELVAKIGPHLAHALRQSVLLTAATAPAPSGPGVVLLAEDLTLLAATPQAEQFLDQLGGVETVPVPLRGVASALRSSAAGVLPSVRVRTRTGAWLAVHASRLRGTDRYAGLTR
ncbi:GAF domain-containing protein [Amycolatopsis sp. NPDC051128]|uniref:GAF domain-containing protein n=1 Tax=Amycolatopsis sp. NPDC051128 TaxID=3155412 RepID=UPI003422E5B8